MNLTLACSPLPCGCQSPCRVPCTKKLQHALYNILVGRGCLAGTVVMEMAPPHPTAHGARHIEIEAIMGIQTAILLGQGNDPYLARVPLMR